MESSEVKLMPIVHVGNMAKSLEFFKGIGGKILFGSRDGDWAEIQFGSASIGLLAHPPSFGEESVELAFASTGSLSHLEGEMRPYVLRGAADEGFGEQLQLQDPDGRKIKINRIDRELIG